MTPKRPRDPAQLAKFIVDMATGQIPPDPELTEAQKTGRAGGLIGGKRRAAKMTPEQRRASAKKAARARWKP